MEDNRVVFTGWTGFLGSFVVEPLRHTNWCGEVFAPRSRDYDLREREDVLRLYQDARPRIAIHLAGVVGGIGADWASTARGDTE